MPFSTNYQFTNIKWSNSRIPSSVVWIPVFDVYVENKYLTYVNLLVTSIKISGIFFQNKMAGVLKNCIVLGQVVPSTLKNAVKVKVPFFIFDENLKAYFKKTEDIIAEDFRETTFLRFIESG